MTCFDIRTVKASGPLTGTCAAIRFDRDAKTLSVWHGDRYPKLNVGELRFRISPKADPERSTSASTASAPRRPPSSKSTTCPAP